jgi:hypothetical protein
MVTTRDPIRRLLGRFDSGISFATVAIDVKAM